MSDLYAVRVAARPDDHTIDLDIKVVHPDSMHIPESPGFALMLLHDEARGDAPLAREVDLDTIMNADWARAHARAFVESVELLATRNEPPPEAEDDYEHGYWQNPARWLEGRLRIRATHPAWIRHVPARWDSASFDPAPRYDPCEPALPGAAVAIAVEADPERSEGFLPAPRLMIASEVGRECPELLWIPRHGARAFEAVEPLRGIDISPARLRAWLGQPVVWRSTNDDPRVGIVTRIDDDGTVALVSINAGSRTTNHARPEHLEWIGRAAFRAGTPRLAPPLALERTLAYVSPAAEVARVDDREATIRVYGLAADGMQPRLETSADVLRLLAIPSRPSFGDFEGATTKLGRALRREMQDRALDWDNELYPAVAGGFIDAFEVEAPPRPRAIDLDALERAEAIAFIEARRWPTWTVHVTVSDPTWLEHLDDAGPWTVDPEELEPPQAWDTPRLWDPERDLDDDDDDDADDDGEPGAGKSTLRRRFELPESRPVLREALPADDPRAALRDHGLWEDVDHPEARDNFEAACKSGNVAAVRAYAALGIDLNSHAEISGETPLIRAAEGNQPEVVRALAAAGVDLEGRDGGGDTAVMTAVNWTNPEVLRALLEVGASPDTPDNYANLPLVKALDEHDDELVEILLAADASPSACADSQDSALHWCLRNNDDDRLRALLTRPGADVDLATAAGDTLLHLAAFNEDYHCTLALLDAGADATRTNRWGWTAHDIAESLGAEALASRLREAGAPLAQAEALEWFRAIAQADLDAVADRLAAGFDVDHRDARGNTALHLAVGEDQRELVELLLTRGAEVNARDGNDANALSHASSTELRRLLLESGIEAAYRDKDGVLRQPGVEAVLEDDDQELLALLLDARTNFSDLSDLSVCHSTLIWGDFEDRLELRARTLRTLGAAGADLDARDPDDGSSLLSGYISRGHEPPALALIEIGVDLEIADNSRTTPLIKSCGEYSSHEIQARITRALLARGADYTKIDWLGRSAWDGARSVSNDECVAALEEVFEQTLADALAERGLPEGSDPEDLDAATFEALARRSNLETFRHFVRKGAHALVRGLLAAGFNPNPPARDEHGQRPGEIPLIAAVAAGDEAMVEILLAGGADPNLVQMYGSTALSYAVGDRQIAIVRRLLAAGADPQPFDDSGHTPMSAAAARGDLEILEILAEASASVQPRASGYLPLHSAVRNGRFEAAQWLLARGAEVDARQEGRITALHLAIEHDEVELALALLAAGADPNVQTSDEARLTPLIRATKKGNVEVIEALLAAGADPHIGDADGQSAIEHASYRDELRALFPDAGAAPTFERIAGELPPLLRAVHLADREAFAQALARARAEAEIDVRNYRGDTALMLAAGFGRRHMLEALLEAGAELGAQNAKGDSAWTYAFCSGQQELRELLEQRGATTTMDALNQMAAQAMRRDAAIEALKAGDVARVATMIDALELDLDSLGASLRPLRIAIDRGDAAMIQMLLAKGADATLDAGGQRTLREYGEAAGHGGLFES